jgi:dipeptidyl aminopeptidase/acylaminoacyl peptidase
LCLVRTYEAGHPRPDLEEFVRQYRKAGGKIDMTVFEGEGEGVLRDISSPTAQQALEQMIAFIHQHLG